MEDVSTLFSDKNRFSSSLMQISHCSLKRFDRRMLKCLSLTHVDLSFNSLTAFPPELTELTNLCSVVLSDNLIVDFPEDICSSPALQASLRSLDINGECAGPLTHHCMPLHSLI